jgi:hypothetical protein
MLVGKSIAHIIYILELTQNDFRHLVQRSLHTRAIVGRKRRESSIFYTLKSSIETLCFLLDILQILEQTPRVTCRDFRRENPIIHVRKEGILVLDVAVESRPSGLENEQVLQSRTDLKALTSCVMDLRHADVLPITEEGMLVRLAVDKDSSPLVLDDGAPSASDVLVCGREMSSDDAGKQFRRRNRVLLGQVWPDQSGGRRGLGVVQ